MNRPRRSCHELGVCHGRKGQGCTCHHDTETLPPGGYYFAPGAIDCPRRSHKRLAGWQRLVLDVFARSNTYRALHSMYEELGAYGTSASIIVDDFDSVIHHHTLTAGEYAIASDYRGKVQTLYREFDLTVAHYGVARGL